MSVFRSEETGGVFLFVGYFGEGSFRGGGARGDDVGKGLAIAFSLGSRGSLLLLLFLCRVDGML